MPHMLGVPFPQLAFSPRMAAETREKVATSTLFPTHFLPHGRLKPVFEEDPELQSDFHPHGRLKPGHRGFSGSGDLSSLMGG